MLSSCVCPSVRPSHAGIFFETTGRIEVVFGMWAIFTYPVQCFAKKLGYLCKYGYYPLELCPKLWTWKISPRQVDRVVNNSITLICWDLLFNLFPQLLCSWQDFNYHSASRGPSAVAELLVLCCSWLPPYRKQTKIIASYPPNERSAKIREISLMTIIRCIYKLTLILSISCSRPAYSTCILGVI